MSDLGGLATRIQSIQSHSLIAFRCVAVLPPSVMVLFVFWVEEEGEEEEEEEDSKLNQKFFCQSYFHLFALWAGKQTILVAFIQQYIEFSYLVLHSMSRTMK